MSEVTIYRVIMSYLERLPNAVKEMTGKDGKPERRCIYTPHSLRATTATLLLDGGTDMGGGEGAARTPPYHNHTDL